jgi:succinyl-CoA synthetase alpha subunit
MTNTNHTPGPWDGSGQTICAGATNIAKVAFNELLQAFKAEAVANARLIASVPALLAAQELLQALENLVASIENVDFSRENPGVYDQIPWAQAEAAIAKAKGVTDE